MSNKEKEQDLPILEMPKATTLSWQTPQGAANRIIDMPLAPLDEMRSLRLRLNQSNILFGRDMFNQNDLKLLQDDPAYKKLPDYKFSFYSMEPSAIDFLKAMITKFRPSSILELGSGLSTAVLSQHLNDLHAGTDVKPHYVSVDQSREYLDETEIMLKKAGVAAFVNLVQMDIRSFRVGENSVHPCYDFDEGKLHAAFDGVKPDFVIIDGPVGKNHPFARLLTMPLARAYASKNALFFLDDALRDSELEIMQSWQAFNDFEVCGVKCVSKGVMVGRSI